MITKHTHANRIDVMGGIKDRRGMLYVRTRNGQIWREGNVGSSRRPSRKEKKAIRRAVQRARLRGEER